MSAPWAIGLDLGGTYLKAGLVDASGRLEHFLKEPCRVAESAAAPLDAIAAAVERLRAVAAGPIAGIGLGSPGVIDPVRGVLVDATPHLPHWRDFPLRDALAARLALPVAVDNDANLAALGEHRCGAARGARLALVVTVGTGVGCGIVAGGAILHGAFGGAGEIGHLPIGTGDLACRCGVPRCIEPEMSGSGLARSAERLGLSAHTASALFAAASGGDAEAARLVGHMADRLGLALAVAVNLLNPDVVVIGGGIAKVGEPLLSRVRAALAAYALESHHRGLAVVPSALGECSGVAGAGFLALESAG